MQPQDYLFVRAWFELFFSKGEQQEDFIAATQRAAVQDRADLKSIYKSVPGCRWNTIDDIEPGDPRIRMILSRVEEIKTRGGIERIQLNGDDSSFVEAIERFDTLAGNIGIPGLRADMTVKTVAWREYRPTETVEQTADHIPNLIIIKTPTGYSCGQVANDEGAAEDCLINQVEHPSLQMALAMLHLKLQGLEVGIAIKTS